MSSRRRGRAGESSEGARARAAAARAISAVLDAGRSLDAALTEFGAPLAPADRALVSAIAYGVLRDRRQLEARLAPRLARKPQPLLRALLLAGLYQLDAMRVPVHASVHASVAATQSLGLGKARGMVNAVLRAHLRATDPVDTSGEPGVSYSYPDWLVAAVRRDWGSLWPDVLAGGNRAAPMHLRVNARHGDRYAAMRTLADAGLASDAPRVCASAITLDTPVAVADLPGFASGRLSVQDGAAQLAAVLLAPSNGQRVLDACAAPGNKSAHLLERADIDLLALDIDAARLQTLKQTLARIGRSARTQVADASRPSDWWGGRAFDRILIDAPCSGTGVIRRHPDIKWLRRHSDIEAAAAHQLALLEALWPTLAPGGRLVYATCSILRAEGSDVIDAFIARTADARECPIDARWGFAERRGRRIASGMHDFDGFYYAILERRGA